MTSKHFYNYCYKQSCYFCIVLLTVIGFLNRYCCPICTKSIMDMSATWKMIDEEVSIGRVYQVNSCYPTRGKCFDIYMFVLQIEATMMPDEYRRKKVWVLCNDCNDTTEVFFHILGHKCRHCKSYNTRSIAPPVLPQEWVNDQHCVFDQPGLIHISIYLFFIHACMSEVLWTLLAFIFAVDTWFLIWVPQKHLATQFLFNLCGLSWGRPTKLLDILVKLL